MSLSAKKLQETKSALTEALVRVSKSDHVLGSVVERLMTYLEATIDFTAELGILNKNALENPVDARGKDYKTCILRLLTSLGVSGDIDGIVEIRDHTTKTMLREIEARQRFLDATAPHSKMPELVHTVDIKRAVPAPSQVATLVPGQLTGSTNEKWEFVGKLPAAFAQRKNKGKSFIQFMLENEIWLKNIHAAIKMEGGLPLSAISPIDRRLYEALASRRNMKVRQGSWKGSDKLRGFKINRATMLQLAVSDPERELVKILLVEQFDPKGAETIFDFLPRVLGIEIKHGKTEFKGGALYAGDLHQQNKLAFMALFNVWQASLGKLHVRKQVKKPLEEMMTDFMDTSVSYQELMSWKSAVSAIPHIRPPRKPQVRHGT